MVEGSVYATAKDRDGPFSAVAQFSCKNEKTCFVDYEILRQHTGQSEWYDEDATWWPVVRPDERRELGWVRVSGMRATQRSGTQLAVVVGVVGESTSSVQVAGLTGRREIAVEPLTGSFIVVVQVGAESTWQLMRREAQAPEWDVLSYVLPPPL